MFTPSSYNLWQSPHQCFLKKAVLMFRELSQKKVYIFVEVRVWVRGITTIYVCVCVGARETSRIENNNKVNCTRMPFVGEEERDSVKRR